MFRYVREKMIFLQLEGNHFTLLEMVVGGKEERKHTLDILKEPNSKSS